MDKVKIAAVSYLNTKPFLYGLQHSKDLFEQEYHLNLAYPSKCGEMLINDEVDIALIPVGALQKMSNYHIISDYCIGAIDKVGSVALYANVPLTDIDTVYLDYQSRTSVLLMKILAKKYWKINPEWIEGFDGYENHIEANKAGVIIGDRTFNLDDEYNFKYDLATAWYNATSLPFVFACWVSKRSIDPVFLDKFNKALNFGIEYKADLVATIENEKDREFARQYLTENISYELTHQKKQGLELFLKEVNNL